MTGLTWALLGLTVGLALPASLLYFRQRPGAAAPGAAGPGAAPAPSTPVPHRPVQGKSLGRFRAVAVQPGVDCCTPAEELAGRRMLGREAPLLPLPLCDRGSACRCTYVHYKDRRAGDERRLVFGSFGGFGRFGSPNAPAERRLRDDRRDLRDRPPEDGKG